MSEGVEWLNELGLLKAKRVLCLVDGEHYPPVTEWAVNAIRQQGADIAGLVFLGGTEKIGDHLDNLFDTSSYPLYAGSTHEQLPLALLADAIGEQHPDMVIDLSDVPVIDYKKRFRLASTILDREIIYAGADFIFKPPAKNNLLNKHALTILGTGKRVGKTAVSITTSRILKKHDIQPAVIAMGRGGPADPVVVDKSQFEVTPEYLLKVVQEGKHAASDYWENAILANIPAIGCRRCGGGFSGNPFITNVPEGVQIANELPVDLVIMEGSGPTLPPVQTAGNILVVGAHQPLDQITGYMDEYRVLNADLVVVTMCEEPSADKTKVEAILNGIRQINPEAEVALTVFRPQPMGNIQNKKIFLATTAPNEAIPNIISYLENEYNCEVCGYSTRLSNRDLLRKDLEEKINQAEVLLTEIKAASIDIAAKSAKEHGISTVFMHNHPQLTGGTIDNFEKAVIELSKK